MFWVGSAVFAGGRRKWGGFIGFLNVVVCGWYCMWGGEELGGKLKWRACVVCRQLC